MPRAEAPALCPPANESQDALSVGSGILFSQASSRRDNDPCIAIKYSQMFWDRCQYRKADHVLNIGMKKFAATANEAWNMEQDPKLVDYDIDTCKSITQFLKFPPAPITEYHNHIHPAPACPPPKKGKKPAKTCERPKT